MIECKEITNVEKLTTKYETVVKNICSGYSEDIFEYKNDLCCRQKLQNVFETSKEIEYKFVARVERADRELKNLLVKTSECIHGNYPENYFWLWGVPCNNENMVSLAKAKNWI